jgi:hypothetical protein
MRWLAASPNGASLLPTRPPITDRQVISSLSSELMTLMVCPSTVAAFASHLLSKPMTRCPHLLESCVSSCTVTFPQLTFIQSAFPKSDANLFEWIGTIEGPTGTVRFIQLSTMQPLCRYIDLCWSYFPNFHILPIKLSLRGAND